MIELRPDILATVKDILQKNVPGTEVRAFGSRVNGKAKKHSDLDLVIIGKKRMDFLSLANLKEAFQESDIPIRVDVVDWHAVSQEFREVINKNCELIQS